MYLEADLQVLQHKKEELENKSIKLAEYKTEIDHIDDKYKLCNEKLNTLENSLKEIVDAENEINKLETEQNKLQTMYVHS